MIGLWILLLMDAEVGVELAGEDDWVAARVALHSPLFGFAVHGSWLSMPRVSQ